MGFLRPPQHHGSRTHLGLDKPCPFPSRCPVPGGLFKSLNLEGYTTAMNVSQREGSGVGKILQASDGDLWSTAGAGGPFGYGKVFAVTASGAAVANVGFNETDGSFPVGGVIQTMRRYAVWRDREARKDGRRRVGVR